MFDFFRKYQKFILGIVGILMISSFAFFGTYSAFSNLHEQRPDHKIGFLADGTPIYERERDGYFRLLGMGREEKGILPEGALPLLFNDGVFSNDFIKTGLLYEIAAQHWDEVGPEIQERFQKVQRYRPFAHPAFSTLSLRHVWEVFSPELGEHLARIQQSDGISATAPTLENFADYLRLFELQNEFPPLLAKRILFLQMRQQGAGAFEESLAYADLSLFHFHSLEDWFGPKLLQQLFGALAEASRIQAQKGSAISESRVLRDMEEKSRKFFCEVYEKNEVSDTLLRREIDRQLVEVGVSRKVAEQFWKDVLSLRALQSEESGIDLAEASKLTQEELRSCEKVDLEVFEIPDYFKFLTVNDMRAFQVYQGSPLLKRTQAVSEQFPFLFESEFQVALRKLDRNELLQAVPLSEIRQWQVGEESHWHLLIAEFPFLGKKEGSTREERLQAIETLSPEFALRARHFAAEQILQASPEREKNLLAAKKKERMTLHITAAGEVSELSSFKTGRELGALLLQSFQKEGVSESAEDSPRSSLASYRDGDSLYEIEPIELNSSQELLSFAEIKKRNLIGRLSKAYTDSFSETEHLKLCESVEESVRDILGDLAPHEFSEADVARFYFLPILAAVQEQKMAGVYSGIELFELEKKNVSLYAENSEGTPFEGCFAKNVGEWSSFDKDPLSPWMFYQVVHKAIDVEKVEKIRGAKREELLKEVRKTNSSRYAKLLGEKKNVCFFESEDLT